MNNATQVTHDDVNSAFRTSAVLTDPDDRLIDYLRVLCQVAIRSDEVRLLASNRCVTINAILMKRYMERMNRTTTIYTWIVIAIAAASLIASFVQVAVALEWISHA